MTQVDRNALKLARFATELHRNSYTDIRFLPKNGWAGLHEFMFTWAIVYGKVGNYGYEDRWCYHDENVARVALLTWDGNWRPCPRRYCQTPSVSPYEPQGWHRHPMTARRFGEDGLIYVGR